MKILFATTYIYNQQYKEFTRNKTGFGMMVNSLFEEISKREDAYLVSLVPTQGHGNIIRHNFSSVIFSVKLRDLLRGMRLFFRFKQSWANRIRYFYYGINAGFIRKILRELKPDMVHIHGISMATQIYKEICEECGIPYMITLHGLIGIDDSVNVSSWEKELEKDILIEADKNKVPISVISSGIKKRIEEFYLKHDATNICVIGNGFRRKTTIYGEAREDEELDSADNINSFIKQYNRTYYNALLEGSYPLLADTLRYLKANLLDGKRIVACVGNISQNKNQIQLCRVVKEYLPRNVITVLIGGEGDGGIVRDYVIAENLNENVIIQGFCDDLESIWKIADINVILSKSEGFGLSSIEGYRYGVPTVIFSDLDAAKDVFDLCSTMYISNRRDEEVARVIMEGLTKTWDKKKIMDSSKRFEICNVVLQYIDMYNAIVKPA